MRETLLEIAQSGVLAPSADNQHVFRLEFSENTIRLWPTPAFAATTERHRRALGLISLGAVLENMRLRAGELGFAARTHWPAGGVGPVAELVVQPATPPASDELAAAIPGRHTNRRMYRGPGLTDAETTLLDNAVAGVEGVQLVWLRGAARRRALNLIWRAESERFLRRKLHEELFSSIRFDLSWRETATFALPPGALEIELPMRPLFKLLRHWALMRPLRWLGVHHLVGLRAGWLPCWQAPALGLLATSLQGDAGTIAVGTALERLWLRSTRMEFAFQPLAASAVLPLQSPGDAGASDQLRAGLTSGWQTIAPGLLPLMVFRLGRADQPAVRTSRSPMEDYLVCGLTEPEGSA